MSARSSTVSGISIPLALPSLSLNLYPSRWQADNSMSAVAVKSPPTHLLPTPPGGVRGRHHGHPARRAARTHTGNIPRDSSNSAGHLPPSRRGMAAALAAVGSERSPGGPGGAYDSLLGSCRMAVSRAKGGRVGGTWPSRGVQRTEEPHQRGHQ